MRFPTSFYTGFILALILHLILGLSLWGFSSKTPMVLRQATENQKGLILPVGEEQPKPEIIKAVNIDANEVMQTINHIKAERALKQQQELARQQAMQKAFEKAKNQRKAEQQHLEQLKEEANKLAIAHKKQIAEEQARLKKLALEKAEEAKRLEELKHKQAELAKKQELETKRLEALALKQKQQKEEAERVARANEKAEQARQKQKALERALEDANNQAKLAGEVNKYKALILNAISARWIVPDNANKNLSSQFRIRLAPDGAVLEVSLIRSSGDIILDRSAQTAIYKASPLPVPRDVQTFNLFRDISLTVRPINVRG